MILALGGMKWTYHEFQEEENRDAIDACLGFMRMAREWDT